MSQVKQRIKIAQKSRQVKSISVALPLYNSERFIRQQLDSILMQLRDGDELILSYNPSTDATWEIIQEYAAADPRVKIFVCEEKGLVPNIESALSHCSGDVIFLSDHDDVWKEDKVEKMLEKFRSGEYLLVMHGRYITDGNLNITGTFDYTGVHTGVIHNLVKNYYCGSCFAFRKELLPVVLPFPKHHVCHDVWIGILAARYGNVGLIHEPLMYYRRHGDNLSVAKRRGAAVILRERIGTGCSFLKRTVLHR